MSEAPERIWASLSDERFDNVAFHGGWSSETSEYHPYEYVRADRIEELEAKLAKAVELALTSGVVNLRTYAPYLVDGPEHDVGYYYGYHTALGRILDLLAELTGGKHE